MDYCHLKDLIHKYVHTGKYSRDGTDEEVLEIVSRQYVYDIISVLNGTRKCVYMMSLDFSCGAFHELMAYIVTNSKGIIFVPYDINKKEEDSKSLISGTMFMATIEHYPEIIKSSYIFNYTRIGVDDPTYFLGETIGYPCPITGDEMCGGKQRKFCKVSDSVANAICFRCSDDCDGDHRKFLEDYKEKMEPIALELYGEPLVVEIEERYNN